MSRSGHGGQIALGRSNGGQTPMPIQENCASAHRKLLRVREVASQLAVSKSQAWNLIRRGHLRALRLPGSQIVVVTQDAVDAYLANAEPWTPAHSQIGLTGE